MDGLVEAHEVSQQPNIAFFQSMTASPAAPPTDEESSGVLSTHHGPPPVPQVGPDSFVYTALPQQAEPHHLYPSGPPTMVSVWSGPGAEMASSSAPQTQDGDLYLCGWNGCQKFYGALRSLNRHIDQLGHGPKRKKRQLAVLDVNNQHVIEQHGGSSRPMSDCNSHQAAWAFQNGVPQVPIAPEHQSCPVRVDADGAGRPSKRGRYPIDGGYGLERAREMEWSNTGKGEPQLVVDPGQQPASDYIPSAADQIKHAAFAVEQAIQRAERDRAQAIERAEKAERDIVAVQERIRVEEQEKIAALEQVKKESRDKAEMEARARTAEKERDTAGEELRRVQRELAHAVDRASAAEKADQEKSADVERFQRALTSATEHGNQVQQDLEKAEREIAETISRAEAAEEGRDAAKKDVELKRKWFQQEIAAAVARADKAEEESAAMEQWAQEWVREAAAKVEDAEHRIAAALQEKEVAERERDGVAKLAGEADRNKAAAEERAGRAEKRVKEGVQLASEFKKLKEEADERAHTATEELAAEIERARNAESEMAAELDRARKAQQDLAAEVERCKEALQTERGKRADTEATVVQSTHEPGTPGGNAGTTTSSSRPRTRRETQLAEANAPKGQQKPRSVSGRALDQFVSLREILADWEEWKDGEEYRFVHFEFRGETIAIRRTGEQLASSETSWTIKCAQYQGKSVVRISDITTLLVCLYGRTFSDRETVIIKSTLATHGLGRITNRQYKKIFNEDTENPTLFLWENLEKVMTQLVAGVSNVSEEDGGSM